MHQKKKIALEIAAKIASVKARLHGRFLLRFSPFGGCEGSRLLNLITTSLSNLLLHIHQKEKIAPKIAAEIARVNEPLLKSQQKSSV
jgi:hypothetical protein